MYNRPGRMAALYVVRNQRRPNVLLPFAVKERIDRRLSVEEQLELVERTFAGDGWEVPRLLAAMRTADDLYFDSVSQIRMPNWTKGRVALIGDAGYARRSCPARAAAWRWSERTNSPPRSPRPKATTGRRSQSTSGRCAITSSRTSNSPRSPPAR